MADFGKLTEKLTNELLFARKFTIKTVLSPDDSAERIESLATQARSKRKGYMTYINSIGDNHYRVLMYTRRFPAHSRTAELQGYLLIGQDGTTRLRGLVRFGQSYFLLAMAGLLFAIFVAMMIYNIHMDIARFTYNIPWFSIVTDMLLIGLIIGIIPVLMLVRVIMDRNHLLKTLAQTLNS